MMDGPDSAWRNRAPGPHRNTARQAMDGLWTEVCGQQKQSNDPSNNQHNPQYANYWAPLTLKRHIPPHSAQPQHTNDWAARTRKRHQQEHRPQRPTERSDPTQRAKGRTRDPPGPRKETTTRRNVTRGVRCNGCEVVLICTRQMMLSLDLTLIPNNAFSLVVVFFRWGSRSSPCRPMGYPFGPLSQGRGSCEDAPFPPLVPTARRRPG